MQFDLPWTDLGALLDPMLAPCWPHVGPMLAPCWRPLGILGHLGAFLERSGTYLEAVSDQQRTEGEKKRLDFRKIEEKKTLGFCWFFEGPEQRSWIILGSSWGSWSDLGGLLGVLGAS